MNFHIELSFVVIFCIIFSKYDCAARTFRLKLRKLLVKSSKKGCVFTYRGFPSFITRNIFTTMLTEDEVLLHLGMRFQLGVLQYLDMKVKEIKTYKHFFNCSL